MLNELYEMPNGCEINVLYPNHGRGNVMRKVCGKKLDSFMGPSGKVITVEEWNGQIRNLSLSKCIPYQGVKTCNPSLV